jgi:hypothetical protein
VAVAVAVAVAVLVPCLLRSSFDQLAEDSPRICLVYRGCARGGESDLNRQRGASLRARRPGNHQPSARADHSGAYVEYRDVFASERG